MRRIKKAKPLGERLKDVRAEKGISLDFLANETGFSVDYLSRLENGQITNPTLGRLMDGCNWLTTVAATARVLPVRKEFDPDLWLLAPLLIHGHAADRPQPVSFPAPEYTAKLVLVQRSPPAS